MKKTTGPSKKRDLNFAHLSSLLFHLRGVACFIDRNRFNFEIYFYCPYQSVLWYLTKVLQEVDAEVTMYAGTPEIFRFNYHSVIQNKKLGKLIRLLTGLLGEPELLENFDDIEGFSNFVGDSQAKYVNYVKYLRNDVYFSDYLELDAPSLLEFSRLDDEGEALYLFDEQRHAILELL